MNFSNYMPKRSSNKSKKLENSSVKLENAIMRESIIVMHSKKEAKLGVDFQRKSYDCIDINLSCDISIKTNIPQSNSQNQNSLFNKLIDLQKINGNWDYNSFNKESQNSELTSYINSNYKDLLLKIANIISKVLGLNVDQNDVTFTILVLIILNQKFSSKKDEFILIENKGKKFLSKKNVDYKIVLKEIQLENLF